MATPDSCGKYEEEIMGYWEELNSDSPSREYWDENGSPKVVGEASFEIGEGW